MQFLFEAAINKIVSGNQKKRKYENQTHFVHRSPSNRWFKMEFTLLRRAMPGERWHHLP